MPRLRIFRSNRNEQSPHEVDRPRVLFVSHEATRTGAPKIILNILKRFHEACDIDCETIVHDEGHLMEEFAQNSEVHCLRLPRLRSTELQKRVRNIVRRRGTKHPDIAICNSMESRFVMEQLNQLGVPVIALVHELPCSYTDADYELLYENTTKIVFPVQTVREATNKKLPLPFGKDLILPQGLLNPHFGQNTEREAARAQIRRDLSIPQDAFVVLGCGTLDLRKGIDHFAAIARSVVRKNNFDDTIHFVWVGEGPRWSHSPMHYVQIDLRRSKTASHVHFVGEREHVDSFFVGSDMFLLSSRVDPFPCVVHEAMSTQLPVMAFDNSGGASIALADGAGFVVPFGDYEQATNIICALAQNPGMAEGMRRKALQRVQDEYNFENYADKIINVAQQLTGETLISSQAPAASNAFETSPAATPIEINRAA